jgi:crotonobetainyl-CoA:carnitine CoA-transferase CaiB-like acyl-CoA transferase
VPSVRNPITFSTTPAGYRLPPPTLDEHGDELRRWLAAPGEERTA